jgi:uncharacterized protein (DUF1778 family)
MNSFPIEESVNQTRDVAIDLRVEQEQGILNDPAVEIQGKKRSGYRKVRDVSPDQTFFDLDEKKYEEFIDLLNSLPSWNEKLHALLTTKAPWE